MGLENGMLNDISRNCSQSNLVLIWLVSLVVGFILVKMVYPRYWIRFRQAMVYVLEGEKLLREKNVNLLKVAVFLNGLASLSIASFLFVSLKSLNVIYRLDSLSYDLVLFSLLIILLGTIKFVSIHLLGVIYKKPDVAARVNHSWLIYLKNFGAYILIIAFLVNYLPLGLRIYAIVFGFAVLFIMQIISYIRGFQIVIQEGISLFYGILYLCTLEILPILMIVDIVVV